MECPKCKKLFNSIISRGMHIRREHPDTERTMCVCGHTGDDPDSLAAHRRSCDILHEVDCYQPETSAAKAMMMCGLCSKTVTTMADLCKHVKDHDITAEIENFDFSNDEEFNKWLVDVQTKGCFAFARKRHRKLRNGVVIYYGCHRSGSYTSYSEGIRAPRTHGSIKCGFTCTAFATSRIDADTGAINVKCCLTHYGHDKEISKIRLTPDIRKKVADIYRSNPSIDYVMEAIKSKRTD